MSGRRAFLLDRDGTINEDVNYLSHPDQLVLIEGAGRAIRLINEAGWACAIITNQSAVARGFITEEELESIHLALSRRLAKEGARIDAIFSCPHLIDGAVERYRRECECRKPKPGLLLRAAHELGLDLSRSVVVGDSLRDVEAGRAAGCRTVLVKTGNGGRELLNGTAVRPDLVAADLLEAVEMVLSSP